VAEWKQQRIKKQGEHCNEQVDLVPAALKMHIKQRGSSAAKDRFKETTAPEAASKLDDRL
jgi:hypothetical protein